VEPIHGDRVEAVIFAPYYGIMGKGEGRDNQEVLYLNLYRFKRWNLMFLFSVGL
jgi:hypothetical protein